MVKALDEAQVLICGAGIAGISAAYFLTVKEKIQDVVLCDPRPPLSLTSSKSTECYRNWWPGPDGAMVNLMNRSISLLEDLASKSNNIFHLNRRGYLYVTARPEKIPEIWKSAQEISAFGAGPLRIHEDSKPETTYQASQKQGFRRRLEGADLLLGAEMIQKQFPYLSSKACAALHVRRAGWFSAQQLGTYLLSEALNHGAILLSEQVRGLEVRAGQVEGVILENGRRIRTQHFINAAGPMLNEVSEMLGLKHPLQHELHLKAALQDPAGAIPRSAPLLIWIDPQRLNWTAEEVEFLAQEADLRWLLAELPSGAHTRPEGGADSPIALMLWEYNAREMKPHWPIPIDSQYAEICLRGLTAMLPGLETYQGRMSRPQIDGGYYTKTPENRPLIGVTEVQGAYILGALSGFGLMAACGAGELAALHVTGKPLPAYAAAFSPKRYLDPKYLDKMSAYSSTGQL